QAASASAHHLKPISSATSAAGPGAQVVGESAQDGPACAVFVLSLPDNLLHQPGKLYRLAVALFLLDAVHETVRLLLEPLLLVAGGGPERFEHFAYERREVAVSTRLLDGDRRLVSEQPQHLH